MSSTNRSDARNSHVSDYYVTPISEIQKFLCEFNKVYGSYLCNAKILDPCAGGDADTLMSYPEALKDYNNNIETIDIREDSRANIINDYLKVECKGKFDVIITNPPFNIAIDVIKKALGDVKDNGIVVMLLRLNYFGSKERKPFWEENMPEHCFIHHRRMSFTKGKGTDSVEYCHMVWRKGFKTEFTKTKVI